MYSSHILNRYRMNVSTTGNWIHFPEDSPAKEDHMSLLLSIVALSIVTHCPETMGLLHL